MRDITPICFIFKPEGNILNRRGFLTTLGLGVAVMAAPSIVRANLLMPVKVMKPINIRHLVMVFDQHGNALKAAYTDELARDLKSCYGLDAGEEIIRVMRSVLEEPISVEIGQKYRAASYICPPSVNGVITPKPFYVDYEGCDPSLLPHMKDACDNGGVLKVAGVLNGDIFAYKPTPNGGLVIDLDPVPFR